MFARLNLALLASLVLTLLAGCSEVISQNATPAVLRPLAAPGRLQQPVGFAFLGAYPQRFYVIEQAGRIRAWNAGQAPWTALDIRSRVQSGGELGLLGMAFSPHFAHDRRVFLSYTRPGRRPISTLSVWRMDASARQIDPNSERLILQVAQPFNNHNGGQIAFGPDGMLYMALGDGGSGGDPLGNGQNIETLFGAILRLDVESAPPYRIPPDNPLVGKAGRDELYAWGLRNPWRFSFDRQSGELWAADVGQDRFEEIDLIRSGGNYGWNLREGRHCYGAESCSSANLIDPVFEYAHGPHCSVTGAYVYRGSRLPALYGRYIFADFCSGQFWSIDRNGLGGPLLQSELRPSAFGEAPDGELYVADYRGGIYALQPAP